VDGSWRICGSAYILINELRGCCGGADSVMANLHEMLAEVPLTGLLVPAANGLCKSSGDE